MDLPPSLRRADRDTADRDRRAAPVRRLTAPPHLWPYDLPHAGRLDLRRWLEAEDLAIEPLNLPSNDQNLCSATEQMRAYSVGQWRAVFELCSDLGVGSVVMVPGRRPSFVPAPADQCDAWLRATLEQLVPAAERAGVRIMLSLSVLLLPARCVKPLRSKRRTGCPRADAAPGG